MKRLPKYLLIFLVAFFAIDLVFGLVLKKQFPKVTFGTYGQVNQGLRSTDDILILGSSRARHHYNPAQITALTGKSCYNAGIGGYGLFYNYALLKSLLESHVPEIVVLDLSANIIVDTETYDKLNIFYPYYDSYQPFKEIIELDPSFSPLKTLSSIYRYNSTLYDFTRSVMGSTKSGNGYLGLKPVLDTTNFKLKALSKDELFDPVKKEYYEKILQLSRSDDFRLICIVSPTYLKYDENNRLISEFERLANRYEVEFYDYSMFDPVFGKPVYFKDQLHLNVTGVDLFNQDFGKRLISNNE